MKGQLTHWILVDLYESFPFHFPLSLPILVKRWRERQSLSPPSLKVSKCLFGCWNSLCWWEGSADSLVSMATAAAEDFLFFRLSTLYSLCLSRVGGGREWRGGVWCLFAWQMESFYSGSCSPTEWLQSCLTKQRDATNLHPKKNIEKETPPNHSSCGFVSK